MSETHIETVEQFNKNIDMKMPATVWRILRKNYPGYSWGVRVAQDEPLVIGFQLAELLRFGDMHCMTINPRDYNTIHEFEQIVKRLGGELLERARLSRNGSQGVEVTRRPDGFDPRYDEFNRERRIVLAGK